MSDKNTINFNTPEESFTNIDELLEAKDNLFEKATIKELEEQLATHQILISPQKVLNKYKNSFNFDKIYNKYSEKYKTELEKIEKAKILFDDRCLFIYLYRIILNEYQIDKLPDPFFIEQTINGCYSDKSDSPAEFILKVLKNINKVSQYHDISKAYEIEEWNFDSIIDRISESINDMMDDEIPNEKNAKKIVNEIQSLLKIYECTYNNSLLMYGQSIYIQAAFGYDKVKKLLKKGLKKFPNDTMYIYKNLFDGLFLYTQTHQMDDLFMFKLFQKAIHSPTKSTRDKDIKEDIKEYFCTYFLTQKRAID